MRQIVAPNFAVAVNDKMGKFVKTRISTPKGERFGIDYLRVPTGPRDKPEYITVVQSAHQGLRDLKFMDLMNYINGDSEKEFLLGW